MLASEKSEQAMVAERYFYSLAPGTSISSRITYFTLCWAYLDPTIQLLNDSPPGKWVGK